MFETTEILPAPDGRTVTITVRKSVRGHVGTWRCSCGQGGSDGSSQTLIRATVNTVVLKQAAGAHAAEHAEDGVL